MHKFFCNYNPLTGKYELSQMRGGFRNSILIQAEVDLLDEIKKNLQQLYENVVLIKEQNNNEELLSKLDDIGLMISNLYYSIFSAPLELVNDNNLENATIKKCINIIDDLISKINIQEQSRLCFLIKNALVSLENN